jgi:two-component system, response regulator YesN
MITLLIADDERTIREGISSSIDWQSLGVDRVLLASDGRKAHAMIAAEKPDIAIVDIVMPEMTGIELIKECRKAREYPEFVIISGHDEFTYAQEALRNHVHAYILKPCDTTEIAATIKGIIGELERRRSMEADQKETQEKLDAMMPQVREGLFRDFLSGAPVNPARLRTLRELFEIGTLRFRLLVLQPRDADQRRGLSLVKHFVETLPGPPPYLKLAAVGDCLVALFDPEDFHSVKALVDRLRAQTQGERGVNLRAAVSAPGAFEVLPSLYVTAHRALVSAGPAKNTVQQEPLLEVSASPYSAPVQKAMQYVEDHYRDSALSLGTVSREILHLNVDYVGKLFRRECGLTFSEYLMTVRMEQAKRIIATSEDVRIYEVASQVGLGNDAAYFSRAFHKHTGVAPGEFRRSSAGL